MAKAPMAEDTPMRHAMKVAAVTVRHIREVFGAGQPVRCTGTCGRRPS